MRTGLTSLLVLGLLLVAAQPASGKELEDRKWFEVQTTNYRIRSILGKQRTLELARHVETLHAAIAIGWQSNFADSPVPTDIYAVDGFSDFEKLGIEPNLEGKFQLGLRKNLLFTRDVHDASDAHVINHQYAHFLLGNRGNSNYPLWYEVGFSEYLSTARTSPGKIYIGGPQNSLVSLLIGYGCCSMHRQIPLDEVLSVGDLDGWSSQNSLKFHAASWALVHYLHHRPERATLGRDMARYIELIESGRDGQDAFEEAFEITAGELNERLKHYLGQSNRRPERKMSPDGFPTFPVSTYEIVPDFEPEVTRLSREQISLALGQAALAFGELDSAQHWFAIALNDERSRAQAEAGLGGVLKSRGSYEAAQPHYKRAVTLAADDPHCQLDYAEYWHHLARIADDPGVRRKYLKLARKYYVNAWKLDDSMPETYVWYGQTFLLEGERYEKAVEMLETAQSVLPSNRIVRVLLAQAYMGLDRHDEAVRAAQSVLAWSSPESKTAQLAKEILADLALETD